MNLIDLIRAALQEDMPQGDATTDALALKPKSGYARLKAKSDLILSGISAFEQTMQMLDNLITVKWHFEEGDSILKGQNICTIQGDLIQVLKAERVALNFLGRLSGISTLTRAFVKEVSSSRTKILDTRKTTPTLREIEKKAVLHGGGFNHRMNLSTAILIKDNHIAIMKGVIPAIKRVRENSRWPIEVEARTLDEVKDAVSMRAHRILLDNMSNEMLKKALELIPPEIETEASGNMTLDRVRSVAELGVNFISVGALTHSAPVADISLIFDWDAT